MIRYIPFLLIALLFSACSYKNKEIRDTNKYSQNTSSYTKDLTLPKLDSKNLAKDFKNKYFSSWDEDSISFTKEEASWGNSYANKTLYLENHLKASKQWFEKQIDNSNFEEFNKVLKKGILTKNTDLRVFPTSNKMFYNPSKAGEGFPFDYNQNSRLKINTPVLISHYSKDKIWAFIETNYILGWVRVDTLLLVNKQEQKEFREAPLYVIVKEGFNIFEANLIEDLKVGTFFPKKNNKYLLATNNGLKEVLIESYKIKKHPLKFEKQNIEKISKEFIGELYGWGGLNNHRDCSSFTQDFLSPFAIYLKRNSKSQTKLHKYIDLSSLSNKEKKKAILDKGIPFLTLVYLQGHIMLYVGSKDNEPLVMHNVWGVRTRNLLSEGRNIIGRTVITSLEPGIELFNADQSKTILKKIKGIVLLNENIEGQK